MLRCSSCIDGSAHHFLKYYDSLHRAHIRFYNTDFSGSSLPRRARQHDARANGDGFVWDKVDRYWWVSIANAATYIGGSGGADLIEDDITEELLEEVVRFADLKGSN